MYLRVQLFHLDNIAIHLGFFSSFFIRAVVFFIFEEALESGKKIIFNKQISDKSGTAVSHTPGGGKTAFHMAPIADSCLPCCGKLSQGSVVYASKTNSWSLRVALPLWFYDWSVQRRRSRGAKVKGKCFRALMQLNIRLSFWRESLYIRNIKFVFLKLFCFSLEYEQLCPVKNIHTTTSIFD